MQIKVIDLLGTAGGLMILFGFYRISIGRWKRTSIWYELDNLVGATLMSIYAFSKTAYVSIAINLVWAFVAFMGVSSYAERKMQKAMSQKSKKRRR